MEFEATEPLHLAVLACIIIVILLVASMLDDSFGSGTGKIEFLIREIREQKMKHLNIKIALLALASLLATSHSMANESALSSTHSSTGKYSFFVKTVDIEMGASKLFLSPELTDSPFLLVKRCEISPGVKGKICKTNGECVASRKDCPRKQKSPHGRGPNAAKEKTLDSDGI